MTGGELVRGLYEAYERRDWAAAEALFHPEAAVEMPATLERLSGREDVVAFQRAYPEPWGTMGVLRVLEDADGAAAEVEVVAPDGQRFALAAFWRVRQGRLYRGTEYWVTVGGEQPPPSRPAYR